MGMDSLKFTLETEDHVPKAEHIDPIKSCLIRDDLHMRAHLHSKGHILTPASKEMQWARAKRPLQWHAKRMGTKTSSSRTRKISPMRSNITSTTRFVLLHPLRCILRLQGDHITLPASWFGGRCPIRG